jgi:hypothetical protein
MATPIASDLTVTDASGKLVLDVTGAGAPARAMLECVNAWAPRAKAAKVAQTPGMRAFLNGGMRSKDRISNVRVKDARGRVLVEVTAIGAGDAEVVA